MASVSLLRRERKGCYSILSKTQELRAGVLFGSEVLTVYSCQAPHHNLPTRHLPVSSQHLKPPFTDEQAEALRAKNLAEVPQLRCGDWVLRPGLCGPKGCF